MPGSTLGLCGVPFFWQKFKTPILLQIPLEKCAINELQGKKKKSRASTAKYRLQIIGFKGC